VEVVALQKLDGSWVTTRELLQQLGISREALVRSRPSRSLQEAVWTTAVVLAALYTRAYAYAPEWGPAAAKARRWLLQAYGGVSRIQEVQWLIESAFETVA
jgi:hypothetical protein